MKTKVIYFYVILSFLGFLFIEVLPTNSIQSRKSLYASEEYEIAEDFNFFQSRRRQLFVKSELLRFFDNNGNTNFHINIKIPNNEIHFIQDRQGLTANLEISFIIFHGEEIISENQFTHRAGARTVAIAQSENHYVLEKIEFTLNSEGHTALLEIQDRNASTTYTQRYMLVPLLETALVSDIEISQGISTELVPALEMFQRGPYQFYVDPIPIIDGNNRNFIAVFQVANLSADAELQYSFNEIIRVKHGEDIVWSMENNRTVTSIPFLLVREIPLGDYEAGQYVLEITIQDLRSQEQSTTNRNFSLTRQFLYFTQRVFQDDNEEFELISYFLNSRQRRLWRDLNEEGRKNFIDRFWSANDPNVASDNNQFLEGIRQRVNEANWRFSYHRSGWRTDMGRIFIKYGNPDTLERRDTVPEARYSRKPYQIWRYSASARTYVFFDFQGNGNFRLVYVRNDDTENTDPGWRGYFGPDFEESSFFSL
ncbi:MAG: GWxTD domain-containing protein [Candidatus Cloacimonetes bacterium]|nr:GWxTD domain-containing protein [Candidatus Cloacimonadota bacterium]